MTRSRESVLVEKSTLGTLTRIGRGGQATVFLAEQLRLPGVDGPLVYKQYHNKILKEHGTAIRYAMPDLILFPDSLSAADQKFLAMRTVWPKALVVDEGRAAGIVMKIIPDAFFFDMILGDTTERQVLEFKNFFRTDAQKRQVGVPVLTDKEKIFVVIRMAQAIEFFHRHDLVIGDFSPNNVALSHPRKLTGANAGKIYPKFLDIDSYRFRGNQPPIPQPNTPSWYPPEYRDAENRAKQLSASGASESQIAITAAHMRNLNAHTDVFKFGLATLRLFDSSEQAAGVYISAEARDRITRMIGSQRAKVLLGALEENPKNRPTMTEILNQFQPQQATARR